MMSYIIYLQVHFQSDMYYYVPPSHSYSLACSAQP